MVRSVNARSPDQGPCPGVLVVWSCDRPRFIALPVPEDGLVLGRETIAEAGDDRLSRQHARIAWNGTCFQVADLASRNGTIVGGAALTDGEVTALPPAVIRTGRTISVLCADIRSYEDAEISLHDGVIGPTLRKAWTTVGRLAGSGSALLLSGEAGVGKHRTAREFHAASGARGNLVEVRCAEARNDGEPAWLERIAAERDDDLDVLLLVEIAELELTLQARLAAILEAEARDAPPRLRWMATTAKDLRAEVQAGRVRDELRRALERREVHVPPLRDRLEDIPWLVAAAVRGCGLPAHPTLVEACLLRPWPGNVSELMTEVACAGRAAVDAGHPAVRAEDLDGDAGRLLATGELHAIASPTVSRTIRRVEDELAGDDPLVTVREPPAR